MELATTKNKNRPTQPTDNQIYGIPANQFSPSAGTILAIVRFQIIQSLADK